jgi:hypothetical protein
LKPSTRNRATQKRTALALLEQAERFAAAGQGLEAERYFVGPAIRQEPA